MHEHRHTLKKYSDNYVRTELAEFLRQEANQLWMPILDLEDLPGIGSINGFKARLSSMKQALYATQRRLEEKAEELEK